MKHLIYITIITTSLLIGNDSVIDKETNLEWYDSNKQMSHINAIQYCKDLELNNHKDWHLPNVKELLSIYNFSHKHEFPKKKVVSKGILKGYEVSDNVLKKSIDISFLQNGNIKKSLHFKKDSSSLSFLDGYWSSSLCEYALYLRGETLFWSLGKNKFKMKRLSPDTEEYVLCVRSVK